MFQCELCDYKCATKGNLKQHIKQVHDKIKVFECDKCAYKCVQKDTLKRHIKNTHNKIKDVACNLCDYKCSQNYNLKIHNKAVHNKIKDIECKLCNYTCSSKGDLKRHNRCVHDKIKDIECKLCDYKCSSNGNLKKHDKQVHDKIKDVKCDICDYKCSSNGTLKIHIKSIHERSLESKRMSLGEFKIYTILKKFRVEFKQEFKFQDLRSEKNSLLRFDFGIQNKNNYLLFEFDGEQHFKKVRWSSIDSDNQIDERLEYIKKCDTQKNDYVRNNNHRLLRIRYDDIDVEDKILDFIIKHYDIDIWKNNQKTI